MSPVVSHPLDHAYYRLNWAKMRLGELKAVDKAYIEEEGNIIGQSARVTINPESGNPQFRFPANTNHLIPVSYPILVGETIYNLRASLDYLVYELAALDEGTKQIGTQFPIQDTQNDFRRRQSQYLRGVNDTHVTAIERLQPFNGVEWTRRLRTISNPDKHRHLSLHMPRNAIAMRMGTGTADPTAGFPSDEAGVVLTLPFTNSVHGQMQVQLFIVLFITFDDGTHVLKTLEEIALKVGETLDGFKPEF
jgi:hypothetical protein